MIYKYKIIYSGGSQSSRPKVETSQSSTPQSSTLQSTLQSSTSSKMLIYCHDRIVDLKNNENSGHWIIPILKIMLNENNINIENLDVDTVDIYEDGTSTFIADGFDDYFINNHENEYDIVVLPDCSGVWVEYQRLENINDIENKKRYEQFIFLIINLMRLVKPNGAIYYGKIMSLPIRFTSFEPFNNNYEKISYDLEEKYNITSNIITYPLDNVDQTFLKVIKLPLTIQKSSTIISKIKRVNLEMKLITDKGYNIEANFENSQMLIKKNDTNDIYLINYNGFPWQKPKILSSDYTFISVEDWAPMSRIADYLP
tara:strand:+ start:15 stop:953 length:939 start_codon:yes stop_codon:yes gene_type:complete